MYPSTEATSTSAPHQPVKPNGTPPTGASYAFLSNPPKHKHKPQPITTRCTPPRSLPRSTSSRRRTSISGSPAFQSSFIALTPTPTSDTPKTPHLTTHGYTAAFATYPRRGSIPDIQYAQVHQPRRVPVSPKRASPPKSAPNSPKRSPTSGSPKRRQYRVPSPASPFAPPSPTRTRTRADSVTRIPVSIPRTPPAPRTPKLSKIRSLTNLRARSPSPAPSSRVSAPKAAMATPTSTPKSTSKRAKRSATPARGSVAYTKYRPMPFIQQMQMIQFLEGGTLDSHIRRHHVHAGQGTAHTGFATGPDQDIAHGYAFTDERGMIWFDEEEEWEFACLLPRVRPQRRRGIKRLLGKRRDEESEDEWEDFVEAEEEAEEDVDPEALLAREDDDLRARDDDLASFGGALEGAWARDRPSQSVLNLPGHKAERKRKRAGRIISSLPTQPARLPGHTQSAHRRTTALKEEFLATAFAPPAPRASPSPPPPRATSPFRMFTRNANSTDDNASRTLFQRQHRAARSVPNVHAAGAGQSFASLGASLRGGDVLDGPTFEPPQSPTVLWKNSDEPLSRTTSLAPAPDMRRRTPSPSPHEPHLRSVSPPPAAARRLGIDPSTAVSLNPFADTDKKQPFRSVRGFKSARSK